MLEKNGHYREWRSGVADEEFIACASAEKRPLTFFSSTVIRNHIRLLVISCVREAKATSWKVTMQCTDQSLLPKACVFCMMPRSLSCHPSSGNLHPYKYEFDTHELVEREVKFPPSTSVPLPLRRASRTHQGKQEGHEVQYVQECHREV